MSTENGNPADAPPGQVPDPAQTPAAPPPVSNPTPEPGAEPFDEARAKATIAKLREVEKQAKVHERELGEARAKLKEHEDAKLSEQERLTRAATDAATRAQQAEQRERDTRLRYEVAIRAGAKGIVDPDAAVRLLDLSAVSFAEDGTPQGIDEALTALATAKPYLLAKPSAPPATAGLSVNPATARTQAGEPVFSKSQIGNFRFYSEHEAEIRAAAAAGRITND